MSVQDLFKTSEASLKKEDPYFKNTADLDEFNRIKEDLFKNYNESNKYEDTDFNPLNKLDESYTLHRISEFNLNSVGRASPLVREVSFIQLVSEKNELEPLIFQSPEEVNIERINQGSVGNCYMLQCLISIAGSHPGKIAELFPCPALLNSGIVVIKLWSTKNQCWRVFITDDRLPAKVNEENGEKTWFGVTPAGPDRNFFWCALLEKCFAKIIDNYPELEAGSGKLTVGEVNVMLLGNYTTSTLDIAKDGDDDVLDKMIEHYNKGCILSLSSQHSDSFINPETGMVNYHGYALLRILQDCGEFTLIQCLNVWGKGGEWIGDWSDESPKWDEHPNIKAKVQFEKKDDGLFWIELKDFRKAFAVVWIAQESFNLSEIEPVQTEFRTVHKSDGDFVFTIVNDTCEGYKLFWVDYDGKETPYGELSACDLKQSSFEGHVWRLRNHQSECVFTLGEGLFAEKNCSVKVSEIVKL